MSDLVRNLEDGFSCVTAHFILCNLQCHCRDTLFMDLSLTEKMTPQVKVSMLTAI